VILEETADILGRLLGTEADEIAIEGIVIGVFFTGVKLSDGSGGVAYTPTVELHDGSRSSKTAADRPAPLPLRGMRVREVLGRGGSVMSDLVRLVVMNALSSRFVARGRYNVIYDTDAFDLLDPGRLGKVGMVGAIAPFLKRLKSIPGVDLSIIEKKPESLKAGDMRFYVPEGDVPAILSSCDTVIITGAAVSNGTIEGLLGHTRAGAMVVVTGPTVSFLPDVLFNKNVTIVSGVEVTDADAALDMLSEGVEVYHLFKRCLRKMNIINGKGGDSISAGRRS
jgi:uncharacterized protein (DUF4213/DUF364 family)